MPFGRHRVPHEIRTNRIKGFSPRLKSSGWSCFGKNSLSRIWKRVEPWGTTSERSPSERLATGRTSLETNRVAPSLQKVKVRKNQSLKSWLIRGSRDGVIREENHRLRTGPTVKSSGFTTGSTWLEKVWGKQVWKDLTETDPGFIKMQTLGIAKLVERS